MLYRLWKGERVYRVSQLKKKEIWTTGQVKLLSSEGAKQTSFTYRGRQCNWETKRDRSEGNETRKNKLRSGATRSIP